MGVQVFVVFTYAPYAMDVHGSRHWGDRAVLVHLSCKDKAPTMATTARLLMAEDYLVY